ncbi:AfsR/SARP family transcriptional regulator [Streptomyces platensis]|uniref:AfsR/SARP family transcriptional regulator n=1 Tax=Streptomyces platensis TaxID=58346 RepID=UPI002E80A233|nr:BTAD domain-containing putative transcriptional regulator [Streptomyces platensis]WUB81606.1 NB-ARC domain-containing protein [Streptomyces platensis]
MVEFLVLGSLEPRESGELIRVRGMRQQRLLALLLVNANRVVPMGVLVDELWENPPSSARQQVHNAVRDLRRILPAAGDSVLITVDVGYRLAVPEDAIDTYRFTSGVRAAKAAEKNGRLAEAIQLLQSAVDLWRGDAFAGIQCPAVTGAAVRLNEQRLTAIEDLMAWRLKAGESSSLVGELQELIAEYPLRDSLRGSLMLALYRSGRQADALAVYDEARRHLADELGLEPGPHLRSLHMAILADAPVVQENAPKPSPEPGDGPVPATGASVVSAASSPGNHRNYLPHCPTDFTGRVTETRFLLSLAERGQGGAPQMVAIDGMGGVGKTTLALHTAHSLAPHYPDGQYFISLHGFSATRSPLTPEQALGTLLQASGVGPDAIPGSLEERSALWRSQLAGQRCLVILDDAADTAQVGPLLPGTGSSMVLVTSRRKLTALDGALSLFLDVFPQEDAMALFSRIVGEQRLGLDRAQVAKAVELCGHLPLAIRIAATRLRDRPACTVADLVERLSSTSQRVRCFQTAERDLMSMLRASYRDLHPALRRFSQLISLHPSSSFDIDHAAAVTGLPADDVDCYVDVLIENNLIRQEAPARYSFHNLVRDCTRELAVEAA